MDISIPELKIEDPNLDALQSDLDHVDNFVNGFESIVGQFREKGSVSYSGLESYTVGVCKASEITWNIESGFENFITDGLKKLLEMISNMCKAIWNFFFGKDKDDSASSKDDVKTIDDLEKKVSDLGRTEVAVLSDTQIEKAVQTGIDAAKAGRSIPAPIKIKVTDTASASRNLVSECEHAHQVAAAEAYKEKEAKAKEKGEEIAQLQAQMKKDGAEAIRKVKEKGVISSVSATVNKEIGDRVGGSKAMSSFKNKVAAPLKVLLDIGREVDADDRGIVMISSQFCMPGGSYWFNFERMMNTNTVNIKWLVEKFGDELEGYIERYTKELEKAQSNPNTVRHGISDDETVKMFNNSRRALKALSEIAAAVKVSGKKIKNIYSSTLVNAEKRKAKLIAIELSKLS